MHDFDNFDKLETKTKSLSHRIYSQAKMSIHHSEKNSLPDWSQEHWSPIAVKRSRDLEFVLCRLDFQGYYLSPHTYPMSKDLITKSSCSGSNHKIQTLGEFSSEISESTDPSSRVVYPTGFVFHESRVGSTLVANLLAANPFAMVYSESSPAYDALLNCRGCSREEHVQFFRDVVTVMGRSPVHKYLFFKFQSLTSTAIDIALEAFPDVPWAFIYRHPVQTVISHMSPKRGLVSQAPCLRSKGSPSAMVLQIMNDLVPEGSSSRSLDAWCCAHLEMLCEHAINAYSKFAKHSTPVRSRRSLSTGDQRAMLINYDALPGIVPRALLPLFGLDASSEWLERMIEEASVYSKARSNSREFTGDSEEKEEKASDELARWAAIILGPSFDKMINISDTAVSAVLDNAPIGADGHIDNAAMKKIPSPLPQEEPLPGPPSSSLLGDSSNWINPHTGRIELGAFARNVASARFEPLDCPPSPEPGYPRTYAMKDLLDNWNPDDATVPPFHYNSLCYFDYQTQYDQAEAYRNAEVPFVVYNAPEVDHVVEKWSDVSYLDKLIGHHMSYDTETAPDNHFMYHNGKSNAKYKDKTGTKPWEPPTKHIKMTFPAWLEKAQEGHNKSLEEREHFYFRVTGEHSSHFLFNELPFYQPKKSLFMVQPELQRGIHCRFGMKSIIAEAHYDSSRNMAGSFGGMRRWILAHPNQCKALYLLPKDHPSARHSEVDWSEPDYEKYPLFGDAQVNEVIMKPGQVLYLPTNWFHYIISLNINFQCNTRSGRTSTYDAAVKTCF